jgi:hypothetical protein
MPAPGFGFSVGDFIAVASLIWQLCQALDDSAEDAKLFKDVQLELFAFNSMILQLQQLVLGSTRLPDEVMDRLVKTLHQVKATIEGFLSRMRNHLAGSLKPAGFKLRGLIPHLFLRLFQLPDHYKNQEYTFVTRNHVAQPVKPTLSSAY